MRWRPLVLIGLVGVACAPETEPPARFEVPRPVLSGVDEAVREQLESRAREVETLLSAGASRPPELAAAIGDLGRHYHAYDLTTDAEICYREALRLDPSSEWLYYLGFLDQVRGELERASASYRQVLGHEPDDLPTRLRLADILTQLGQRDEAERLYREVLDGRGADAAAHRGLGRLAADAGRHRQAIDHFERALESQPAATSLHYQLSLAYRAVGDEQAAALHIERSGNGQPSFADPRVAELDRLAVGAGVSLARGGVALAEGRVDVAAEEYRRAVAAAPENPAARTNLALVLASLGERAEAREQLVEALRLEPESPHARLALANLLASDGELERAIEELDLLLGRDPGHGGALRSRAAARLALGQDEAALSDLRAVVDSAPGDGAARLQLGSLLQQAGAVEAAEEQFQAALELELSTTEEAAAELSLGNLSARRAAFGEALTHYDRALELAPRLTEALFNRAGVLARLGRYDEATAGYWRVVELEPGHGAARFYLGDALLRQGDSGNAVAVFAGVAAADPLYERARLGIAVGLKRMGRRAEALESLEESMAELPRSALLAHELAITLASSADRSLRDGERAVELAGRLFSSRPSPLYAETLAMALAEAGRFDEAVEIQNRLIAEVGSAADPALLARLRTVLSLYQRGEACCPPPS